MKKLIGVLFAAMALLLGSALPGHAWGGYGGHYGHGGRHGFSRHHGYGGHYGYRGHYRYGRYEYGSPYRYYPHAAPKVSAPEPTVHAQPPLFWYYCEDARAYHPYVQQCPTGWMKVVPPTTGPGQ